jgi:glycosyltransferase involved in cell wall biosynthesis
VSCQAHRLASELVALGEQITCFSYSEKPAGAPYGHVKLTYVSRSPVIRRFETATGFRRVKTDAFDIVHYHGDDYLCRGSRRRVRTFYGSALYEAVFAARPLRFFRQALFYKLEWLSCLRRGTPVGISAVTRRALPLVKYVIPCGVPLRTFTPAGVRSDAPTVLFAGDLDSRKRGRLLLDAFAAVGAVVPQATLAVVGPQECSGPGVRFLGRLGEEALVNEYRKAWVYCCPSSYEGFGVPILEAMACGAAVVACDNAGVREIVGHNANGILCRPDSLAETLVRVLSDAGLRQRLAANGLAFVKKYDIASVAKQYRDLYNRVCERAGEGP